MDLVGQIQRPDRLAHIFHVSLIRADQHELGPEWRFLMETLQGADEADVVFVGPKLSRIQQVIALQAIFEPYAYRITRKRLKHGSRRRVR